MKNNSWKLDLFRDINSPRPFLEDGMVLPVVARFKAIRNQRSSLPFVRATHKGTGVYLEIFQYENLTNFLAGCYKNVC